MNDSDNKRILLVIRHPVGGIKTYIKYIYSQSVFDEFDFTVLVLNDNVDEFFNNIFSNRKVVFLSFETNIQLIKKLITYLFSNDISIIHSHGFTAGCLSALVNVYYCIPHLMTAHETFYKNQFLGYRGIIKKNILSFLFRKIHLIHTVSNDSKAELSLQLHKISTNKIRCIPHGIDSDKFYFSNKAKLNINTTFNNVCLIGFFGRFMAPKGFRVLIDAIEIITTKLDVKKKPLVLTFDWGGFVREDFSNIKSRGLDSYFQMLEFTDNMPSVIKSMDIVAMPSLSEASGLVGMEALVAGVPIIGTSCTGLREVLSGSPAVMVPPNDANSLAQAIAEEINFPRKESFKQYASIAKEKFSIERPALELKKLYDEMLDQV